MNLDPEDRKDLEIVMESACLDELGKPFSSAELGDRLLAALQKADSMGKDWAAAIINDAARVALLGRAKRWLKTRYVVHTEDGEDRLVTRAAVYSLRRQIREGLVGFQPVLIQDMTAADVERLLEMSREQLRSARLNVRNARKLKRLMDAHPTALTVGQALSAAGESLDDYLGRAA